MSNKIANKILFPHKTKGGVDLCSTISQSKIFKYKYWNSIHRYVICPFLALFKPMFQVYKTLQGYIPLDASTHSKALFDGQ